MTSNRLLNRWSGVLVLLVAAAAIGFGAGVIDTQRASAGESPYPNTLKPYTYSDGSACAAGSEKDPVNVVFVNYGIASEIATQASNHGGWGNDSGSTQEMGDVYNCADMTGKRASNPDFPFQPRFHMRYFEHYNGLSRIDVDDLNSLASAAAHHEDLTGCGHAVDDDTEVFVFNWVTVTGGFNRGREDIRKNWVENSDHVLEDTRYWDNRKPMEQCDHDPPFEWGIATGDGWVYYIRTFDATTDYDNDGCKNEAELQVVSGSETTGGLRDPTDPWDYYDVSAPKDGVIDLFNDILGVIAHYAPGGAPPYNAYYDRGPSPDGAHYWKMTAPDGVIDLLNDILGVTSQNAHNCIWFTG